MQCNDHMTFPHTGHGRIWFQKRNINFDINKHFTPYLLSHSEGIMLNHMIYNKFVCKMHNKS